MNIEIPPAAAVWTDDSVRIVINAILTEIHRGDFVDILDKNMQHTAKTLGEKSTDVNENTHGPYLKFSQLQLPTLCKHFCQISFN